MKSIMNALVLALIMNTTSPVMATPSEAQTLRDIASHSVNIFSDGGTGSGTIIDAHHVLTALHVVPDSNGDYMVVSSDGRFFLAQVERSSPESDLAMLVTYNAMSGSEAVVAEKEPDKYSPVATVGYPLNLHVPVATTGVYNGIIPEEVNLTLYTLPITFGNSGGGIYVISDSGKPTLVGVVHAMAVSTYLITDYPTFHLLLGISYSAMMQFLRLFSGFGVGDPLLNTVK